jgi:hypothetical protein
MPKGLDSSEGNRGSRPALEACQGSGFGTFRESSSANGENAGARNP